MAAVVSDILQTRLELLGLGSYVGGIANAAQALGLFEVASDKAARRQLGLGIATGAAALGIAAGLAKAAHEAGKMEQVRIAFKTLLGSADAANAKIKELQDFAAQTPFNFEGVVTSSQQLLAMGERADRLVPTLRTLGDAVSALGGGTDVLQRVIFNFGQIRAQGRLTMRELRDFAIAGIPVFKILNEELGVTQEQLSKEGATGIDAERGLSALIRGLNKRFGGAMEAQSKTLIGSLSNLKDVTQQLAVSFGEPLLGPVTGVVKLTTDFLGVVQKAPPWVKTLGTLVGVGLAGAFAINTGAMLWSLRTAALLAGENAKLEAQYYRTATAAGVAATAHTAAGNAAAAAGAKTGVGAAVGGAGAGLGGAAAAAGGAAGLAGLTGFAGVGGVTFPAMAGSVAFSSLLAGLFTGAAIRYHEVDEPVEKSYAGEADLAKRFPQGAAAGSLRRRTQRVAKMPGGSRLAQELGASYRDMMGFGGGGGKDSTGDKLDKIAGLLQQIKDQGMPVSTREVSGAQQMAAIAGIIA